MWVNDTFMCKSSLMWHEGPPMGPFLFSIVVQKCGRSNRPVMSLLLCHRQCFQLMFVEIEILQFPHGMCVVRGCVCLHSMASVLACHPHPQNQFLSGCFSSSIFIVFCIHIISSDNMLQKMTLCHSHILPSCRPISLWSVHLTFHRHISNIFSKFSLLPVSLRIYWRKFYGCLRMLERYLSLQYSQLCLPYPQKG